MKILKMMQRLFIAVVIISQIWGCTSKENPVGHTEITKWQYGKDAALSLTYDDGSINQFRRAIPIMNRLNFPATFFVITGNIPGSQYQGKFIGRPVQTIINETAKIPTNKENFFERASAVGYLGYEGTLAYHKKAGALYDGGKIEEAYKYIDETYKKVRNGEIKRGKTINEWAADTKDLKWNDIRKYASQGHEFASHTVTHPKLAALDEVNMLYELEKSKADILKQLGPKYIFSAECPFGTENERVMEYAHKIYPALRNRMPAPYLEELNRASKKTPGNFNKEYVQWQRGANTKTPLPMIKSWVDTVLTHNNNWLVLVIHGVDSIGYEALPHEFLDEYFHYIKNNENKIWVATFGDVTKYMRQRMSAKVQSSEKESKIMIDLTHPLDQTMYNIPLTLKTYISPNWKEAQVKQGNKSQRIHPAKDEKGTYILYQIYPNAEAVELSGV